MSEPAVYDTEYNRQPWRLSDARAGELDLVLHAAVGELAGGLAAPVARIVGARGQRLRPALTLAVAALGGGRTGRDAEALGRAGAVELLHCATLVHDDLIDGATLRRGVPTVNAAEGECRAILSGDLLIAAACLLAARAGPDAGMLVAQTLASLCRGEALEEDVRFDASVSVETLLDIVALKTGSLIQAACVLGAQTARLDRETSAAIARFGMEFGMSLQLLDDVVDVVSTPVLAGKPVGVDFLAGTVTLPSALAMEHSPELRSLLRPGLDDVSRRRALALLRSPPAVRAAVAVAGEHIDAAGDALLGVNGGNLGFTELAAWPRRFFEAQLATKVGPAAEFLRAV